jgi:signal transduction histidine kinase
MQPNPPSYPPQPAPTPGQVFSQVFRFGMPPLDAQMSTIYQQMLRSLQRDMLILLVVMGVFFALLSGAQVVQGIWVTHTLPLAMLVVHVIRVVSIVSLVLFFAWRNQITPAWVSWILLSVGTLLIDIWLTKAPGLIVVAVFSLVGFALTHPIWLTTLITGGIIAALLALVGLAFPIYPEDIASSILIFCILVFGCACIGIVIRRFARRYAQTTIVHAQTAVHSARLEQQMLDLRKHLAAIASLEHDLRQPLRVVQGYHTLLQTMLPQAETVLLPAAAAVRRAERLASNLLDLARADAQAHLRPRQLADINLVFAELQQATPGLVHYYTEPPIPVHFAIQTLPLAAIDPEQLERALLNLLDNALVHSPLGSQIDIRACVDAGQLAIEVRDGGPGIPEQITRALLSGQAPEQATGEHRGLGLRQVYNMAQAHQGMLAFPIVEQGALVRITLPLAAS